MQFICDKDALNTALTPAMYAVSTKSTNSAVECLHLSADITSGILIITGYDLEKGVRVVLPEVIISFGGELIVNAQKFAQIIRGLPDGDVTVSADDKYMLTITSGKSNYTVGASDAKEYPNIPGVESQSTFRVKQSTLKQMLAGTLFAVAVNNPKPVLNGALFDIEGDVIKIVGLDGCKLACREESGKISVKNAENSAASTKLKFIVSGKSLSELQRILRDNDDEVEFELGKKMIVARLGNITFFARLIDGEFMNYNSAIPKTETAKVVVDRKRFIESVERTSVMIETPASTFLKLNFMKDENSSSLEISSKAKIGNAFDSCDIEMDGSNIEIGFNYKYLLDTFKMIRDEKIALKLDGSLRPMVILPVDEYDKPNPKYLYLVVPVRLRNETA